MVNWKSKGKKYFYLKIANCVILFFWIIFFFDGVSDTTKSVEVVKDFEEFKIHTLGRFGRASGSGLFKKITTDARSFTTYADENGFFITDTLELKLTPTFGLVKEYRQYPPRGSEEWIYHKLCSHNYPPLIVTSIVLFLMTVGAIFFNFRSDKFKMLSFFTIAGGFIFFMSLIT